MITASSTRLRAYGQPWAWVVLACHASFSTAAFACGPKSARAAVEVQAFAGKFFNAAQMCAESQSDWVPTDSEHAPSQSVAAQPVVLARQMAMYEPTAPVVAPAHAGLPRAGETAAAFYAPPAAGAGKASMVRPGAAARAMALAPQISWVANAYRIDPLLLHAIAHVESRHNPQAVSHAGAVGLMQVMPATARRFGVTEPNSELRDATVSLEVSSAYLKTLQQRFDNNLSLVLAAYNAGEGAVEKYGRRIPPYPETQSYVRDVLAQYQALLSASGRARRNGSAPL